MLDVISAILDIENTAKEMMENAQQQRDGILSEARDTEQSIKDDISADVRRTLDEFEQQQKEESELEIKKISSEKQAAIEKLDSIFEENHGQWETQIYNSIIGVK